MIFLSESPLFSVCQCVQTNRNRGSFSQSLSVTWGATMFTYRRRSEGITDLSHLGYCFCDSVHKTSSGNSSLTVPHNSSPFFWTSVIVIFHITTFESIMYYLIWPSIIYMSYQKETCMWLHLPWKIGNESNLLSISGKEVDLCCCCCLTYFLCVWFLAQVFASNF